MKLLQNTEVKNKIVLVRVDFNVPIEKGKITDNTKIKSALPTIKYLIKKKAKILLLSHLGRPKGKRNPKLSMNPVSEELEKIIKKPVKQLKDCIGPFIISQIDNMKPGEIFMLENARFYKEEEKNNNLFAKKLASLADIYVNDAFSASHRKHASIVGIPKLIPSCAGLLLQEEIKNLQKIINPQKPFVLLLGGAKVNDKIPLIEHLADKTHKILIAGAMHLPFWKVQNKKTGKTKIDKESLKAAEQLLKKYKEKILLPKDTIIANKISNTTKTEIKKEIPENYYGLDIGPETIKEFKQELEKAKTIFWNGPLGVFEIEQFAKGTNEIAKHISTLKNFRVIGGGETLLATQEYRNTYNHASTGGGACLEFLSGRPLPGIKALE